MAIWDFKKGVSCPLTETLISTTENATKKGEGHGVKKKANPGLGSRDR